MMMRKIAATLLGATATCLLFASQASAAVSPPAGGSDYTWTTGDTNHGGTIYVTKHGDYMVLCDTAADGMAARASIWTVINGIYDEQYEMVASGGNGTCVEHDASDGGVYDLPENTTIFVQMWVGTNSEGLVTHTYDNNA